MIDYKVDTSNSDIALASSNVLPKSMLGSSKFSDLALFIMTQEDLSFPKNAEEARTLYDLLINFIDNI